MNPRYVLYGLTALIYTTVAFQSYGFDDEFFNISLVEKHGLSTFLVTQLTDVHPPLSYLLNALLYEALGNWTGVRLISALTICAAFFYVGESIGKEHGHRAAVLTFLLLATNPALLLWGTSVRWYAYFLPVLLWLVITPKNQNITYWAKLGLGLVVLGHIGYITFILAPALILIYWLANSNNFKNKIKYLLASMGCAVFAYLPQFLIFLNVHFPNRESQIGSIFKNFTGVFITQFSNQAVFPISIAGLMGATGTLIIMYLALTSQRLRAISHNHRFISYALFVTLTVLSGIGSKFRNFVIATPLQALWLGTMSPKKGMEKIFYVGISLVLAGNLWGVINIYRHQDTTKNSWNLPIELVLSHVKTESHLCNEDAILFVHDPTLSYHFEKLSLNLTGPYVRKGIELKDSYKCVFVVKTFPGSISNEQYEKMLTEFESLNFSNKTVFNLQEDSFYDYKVKLDSRYPRHAVTIIKLESSKNVRGMTTWLPHFFSQ